MSSCLKKALVVIISTGLISAQSLTVLGQVPEQAIPDMVADRPQPPMQNVFFNVLWGSLTGGMLMMGWSTVDDSKEPDERYTVSNMTSQFLSGATYGGLISLAVGVYLSFKGITFDESRSRLAVLQAPSQDFFPSAKYKGKTASDEMRTVHLLNYQYQF